MDDNNEKDKKVEDIKQKYEERAKLREKNNEEDIEDKREDFESKRRKLKKTDVKKMTTYKNKIKTINDDLMPAILQDLNEVNMGFYVDEIATTVISVFKEGKIKSTELKDIIIFITEMNIRYENFLSIVQDQIQDIYTAEKDIKKRKLYLRIICEMSLCGLFPMSTAISILKSILPGRNKGENQTMIVLLLDVIKMYGCELFGFLPQNIKTFAPELLNTLKEQYQPIEDKIVEKFVLSISNYYNKYVKVSHELSRKEAYLNKIKILRGEIPPEMEEEYTKIQNEYNGYKEIVNTISDYVGLELPKIEEKDDDNDENEENENESLVTVIDNAKIDYEKTPFQDEQTYSFYKNLPNLREAVPASLLGTIIIENKSGEKKTLVPLIKQENRGTLDDAIKQLDSFDSSPVKPSNTTSQQQQQQQQQHTKTIIKSDVDVEIDTNKQNITELFSKLTDLRTTEEVDKWAIQFCYINSKTTRARLIEELLNCPVNQFSLLVPLYCRLAASLKIVVKDIGLLLSNPITKKLAGLFLNTLDQNRYDIKSYYITYLAELTKFELSPPGNALYIAKILLKKPTIIRLEYLTSLMENCGLFLMFIAEIESETNKYLNTLMNIKSKIHDVRLSNMLMNVYYICRPSERPPPVVITIPTPLLYMKYLLLEKLDKDKITDIVNEILNFDLEDPEISDFFIKTVLSTYNYKYNSIECLAQVLDELYAYKPMLILKFRDSLLETIYLDLEENNYTKYQQRVCQIKLLGECFNYQIIEFDQLMEILYLLIHFSHRITEDNKEYLNNNLSASIVQYHPMITSLIDPPEDSFRIILVCEILTTIQEYIKHDDYANIFHIYSLYFQRYILSKKLITIDIQWQLNDSFYTYFPDITNKYDSIDKIELALSNIENTTSGIIEKTKMYGLFNLPEYDLMISGNKENIAQKVAKGKSKKIEISAEEVENQKILSQLDQDYQKMIDSSKSHVGSLPTAQSVDNMIIPIEIQSKVQKSNGCFLLLRRKDGKVETKEMEIADSDKAAQIRKEKREQREKEQAALKAKIVAYQRTLEERAEHPDYSDEEI